MPQTLHFDHFTKTDSKIKQQPCHRNTAAMSTLLITQITYLLITPIKLYLLMSDYYYS